MKTKKKSLDQKRKLRKLLRQTKETSASLDTNKRVEHVTSQMIQSVSKNSKDQQKELNKKNMAEKRRNTEFLAKERENKRTKREDDTYRSEERKRDAQKKASLRDNEVFKSLENTADRERIALLRENEIFRSLEKANDRKRKASLRDNETLRLLENVVDRERKASLRENETFRLKENKVDQQRKSLVRQDETYRAREKIIDKQLTVLLRKDEIYKVHEQERDKKRKTALRQDEKYRSQEKVSQRLHKSQKRQNEAILIKEREAKRIKRQDESYRTQEKERDKVQKRLTKTVRNVQQQIDSGRANFAMPITEFEMLIKEGPTESCNCCLRLIFPRLAVTVKIDPIIEKFGLTFVEHVFYDQYRNIFCGTCAIDIKRGDIPTFCHQNYKIIFDVPPQLKGLTILEERLVSPRIPFMQIRRLGYDKQCSIRGQVVNVPIEINTTVRTLPRHVDDTHTIQLKLMRKMSHKYAFSTETVRPKKVFEALKYLVDQPLYKSEKITISQKFLESQIEMVSDNNLKDLKDICEDSTEAHAKTINDSVHDIEFDSDDSFEENIMKYIENHPSQIFKDGDFDQFEREDRFAHLNPAGEETLLDNTKIENIAFAPGEGQLPIHLLFDANAEELSFPTIFCGNSREFQKKMSYAQIAKLQASHRDRRFARTDFLLYMFKKAQMISVIDKVSMAIRKKKPGKDTYTAGQLKNKDFISKLIQVDEGYRFLRDIRTSPAHWEMEKRKLVAMIRQFDIPTLFITISAAESMWPQLLVILSKVVDNKVISENEAMTLHYNDKTRLIRSDPIVCARYFDNRFHLLLKHMKSDEGPFKNNPITHYYYRVEFQHRGSPHVHSLFWLENAPIYNSSSIDSKREVAAFIDKYITCNGGNMLVQDVINYQVHHHSKSCKKMIKEVAVCRYNIPFFPSDITLVLEPNNLKLNKEKQIRFKHLLGNITSFLNSNKEDITFPEFLQKFDTNIGEYREFLRNVIKKPTIILKRAVKDCLVNAFNEDILRLQKSNMDIQFVLDPYACMAYIVNYINKADRGVSKLLREAMAEIKQGNLTIKEQLKKIGYKFLNASEVSAQEAAYNILQMHLSEASDSYVNINSKPQSERVRMLKQTKDLDAMAADDTDIYELGLIEHYIQRPESLDNICLAEFAAYYTFTKSKKVKTHLDLKDGSGALSKKRNPKIINFVRYGFLQDPVNFYREQIMLYYPWHDETRDIENVDQVEVYQAKIEIITENRKKFDKINEEVLDAALKAAEERNDHYLFQHLLNDDFDEEYIPYALKNPKYDPMQCLDRTTMKPAAKHNTFQTPLEIDQKLYSEIISTLNAKQYEFLNHVLDSIINGRVINQVVSGGAGVGKSRLIIAIQQSLLKYFNSLPGNNPDLIKVLLAAPTGKAAYGINGMTVHSAFGMPVTSYSNSMIPLNQDSVNSMHTSLIDLKLVIIDEFSMVGSKMFHNVDQRMKQIFKNKNNFGGISVILFGDIRQLPPVGDKWIFSPYTGNCYNIICGSYLWDQFKYFELTEIMRQRNDGLFAIALNNMAKGAMTEEDIKLIKSREIVDGSITVPSTAIHLFKSNKLVDSYNEKRLSEYDTETSYSIAQDIVKGSCAEKTKQLMLKQAKKLSKSDSFGLILKLQLQIDAKYMVSVNLNTQDGIVNGASCVLRYVQKDPSGIPIRVWVEFDNEDSGKQTRKEYSDTISALKFSAKWTPLELCAKAIKIRREGNLFVERKQFAILPAEAITIHKSQGATYNQVAIHIEPNISRNFLYVACSRVTSLNGLYIYGKFVAPKKPDIHDLADIELKRLKETKCLESKYSKQFCKDKGEFVITYHNIEGFHSHKTLIMTNPIFVNSDILLFVETWNYDNSDVSIDGFTNFANIARTAKDKLSNKGYGISCYCKDAISKDITLKSKFEERINKSGIQCISFTFKETLIGVFYISPNLPKKVSTTNEFLQKFLRENDDVDTLIIGDFNQDLMVDKHNSTLSLLKDMNFSSELKLDTSTTKSNTHIDWCFSNSGRCIANTHETVFSHHKAIAVSLYENKVEKELLTQSSSINEHLGNAPSPHVSIHSLSSDEETVENKKYSRNTEMASAFSSTISDENMKFKLDQQDKHEIKTAGAYLGDQVINRFHEVLSNFSRQENTINELEFYPQDVLYWQSVELLNSRVHEIQPDSHNIQILYGGQTGAVGHWICTYYDGKEVYIYDSLNHDRITDDSIQRYLNKLYPFKSSYVFHKVQQQNNLTDCGLFAIANAVSVYFKKDPRIMHYDPSAMRSHLWKILSTNVLEIFPAISCTQSAINRPVYQKIYKKSPSPVKAYKYENINKDAVDINGSRTKFKQGYEQEIMNPYCCLTDLTINRFHETLCKFSRSEHEINEREYYPQDVTYWQSSDLLNCIKPIPKGSHHIQILYGGKIGSNVTGHWICTHYDGELVNIYDSLNSGMIEEDSSYRKYLDKLYPFQPRYVLHEVERQSNSTDCGLFAIANAVCIYFNIELREKVKYDTSKMRGHLAKILRTNTLEVFPHMCSKTYLEMMISEAKKRL